MLLVDIESLISEAMKAQDKLRLATLRLIKTELFKKSKEEGMVYTEEVEKKTLSKMVDTYNKALNEFKNNNRNDLAEEVAQQLEIIKEFAPKVASEEDVIKETEKAIETLLKENGEGYTLSMKDMPKIKALVEATYPSANGKIISSVLRSKI